MKHVRFPVAEALPPPPAEGQLDATHDRRAQPTLVQSEAGLHRAQLMAKLAHVITGPDGAFETWSATLPQLIGVQPPHVPRTTRAWLEIVHPDDRLLFREKAIEAAKQKRRTELEYRLRRADGQWIHMRQTMEPLEGERDAAGGSKWFNTLQDVTAQKQTEESLRSSETRFRQMAENISDVFFLVDAASYHMLYISPAFAEISGRSCESLCGKLWTEAIHPDDRASIHEKNMIGMASGKLEYEYRVLRPDGSIRWVESRAFPVRDDSGSIVRIAGVAKDITERKRAAQDLGESESRFRSLSQLSSDWYWEQDEEYRFVRFAGGRGEERWGTEQNGALGLRRWELPGVIPVSGDWDEHKARLAARKPMRNFEYKHIAADGVVQYLAASGEPVFDSGGRFTGYRGVATDITKRKQAEDRFRRLNRVYAVLSGINTLIVRVQDRDELFRGACRIAVEAGLFRIAWLGLVDRDAKKIVPVATAGPTAEHMALIRDRLTLAEDSPTGNSLTARAIREKRVFFSNDTRNDPAVLFRKEHLEQGTRSMAVLPLLVSDEALGALVLYTEEAGFFDAEELKLLTELAGDISFALDNIGKAEKLARTNRVNAMLSSINGAIVRVRDRQELFDEACHIAVEIGGLTFAWLGVVDEAEMRVRPVASAGAAGEGFLETIQGRLSLRDDAPEGNGITATSVRERRPWAVADVGVHPDIRNREACADRGIKSMASLPMLIGGKAVGAFVLHAAEAGFFDDDEMKLLCEVAGNIAFALEHIEKEEKVQRLTRVYAVLSGINALIIRARDRDELFREACQIAIEHGRFKMAWIGVVDRSAMKIVPVASAGAEPEFLALIQDRFSLREDSPHGNTRSARAVREKKAIVANKIGGPGDTTIFFAKERVERGILSMAILPLLVADDAVGVLALYAGETDFFDDEEVALLTDLAGNIAFAIDHIANQQRLSYLAYYDALTGLANRSLFLERVAQYMRSAVSGGHKLAVFVIDLERFKSINDSLGRPAGDVLLKQVSEWLTSIVGDANLAARMEADHFAVVLPQVKKDGNVTRFLERFIEAFMKHPFRLNDAVFRIAAKIGIALFPDDGADADALFRNAEAALKKAKAGGDRYLLYTQNMTEMVAVKLTLENQLRQALDNEEFVLHYQPKGNFKSGKLTGAEALIRWNDPRTGLVPPGRFIPVLEETGLIHEVGRWALRKAVAEHLRWRAAGLAAVRIAVNVSPLQLRNREFVAEIKQAIGIDAHAAAGLEIEITESVIMADINNSIATLQAIRDLGVTIAIDDFGTGFSSLSYLAKLPVDTLKIDRSFVTDMTTSPEGLALVSTIINLAHSMKLNVVAEGVETEEQSRLLRLLDCDEMQGFLFSKPVPIEVFEARFLTPPPA